MVKLVLGNKGVSKQIELDDTDSRKLYSKKVGETIKGELIGLEGYELLITGGSDRAGFPMRKDVDGGLRRRILAIDGVGFKKKVGNGVRRRRTVAGNQIYNETAQVNLKVVKEGKVVFEKIGEADGSKE